jgi:Flp pilus assembly protein TadD
MSPWLPHRIDVNVVFLPGNTRTLRVLHQSEILSAVKPMIRSTELTKIMKLSILFLILSLLGCGAVVERPGPELLVEIRGGSSPIDDADSAQELLDVLALNDEMKAFVDERIDPGWRTTRRLSELRNLLFSPELFAIEYESGNTKTAVETYESGSGNCLSMTNLFIALARYSGLDANYHLVKARPEWDHAGNVLIWTQHINSTGVLRSGENYVLDFLPDRRVLREDMATVSDRYALAIFYNNLAAEAILDKQNAKALELLRTAIRLEPGISDVWNNMGATQRRLGRTDLAKASYQEAIYLDSYNNTAMSNLSRILFAEGDEELGRYYRDRVSRYRLNNPYYRYASARLALFAKDYEKAREELNAAILLKNDDASFFIALAKAYEGLGDEYKQEISLELARQLELENNQRSSLEIYRSGDVILR